MITSFQISDALRCIVLDAPGANNLATPTELIVRCRPLRNSKFWAQSLGRNTNRVTVGDWNGIKLDGLASVRIRSGTRSWEVDRLHLNHVGQAFELLEKAVYFTSFRGAERVFLRLPQQSELIDAARKVGFFPYFNEVHLSGRSAPLTTEATNFSVKPATPADVQGLFQLYCAATPHEIRQGIGMTIDQWKDSQEPAQAHRDESILKLNDKIVGWRTCDNFGKATALQALGHPEHTGSAWYLTDLSNQTQNWLVPNYQQHVAELLRQKGLRELGRYTMLIKTVSVLVRSREFSYMEA